MKKLVALFIPIALTVVIQANAQTTPGINDRQQSQHARIHQGVASGELTRREAKHARHDQRHIRRTERCAKADGHVTNRERARLHYQQSQASRELSRNKHDAQTRRVY